LALLVRRHQEHVANKQLCVVLLICADTRRRIRQIHHPTITFFPEQSCWHRRARTDLSRIKQPAERPIRLEPLACQQEVWRNRFRIARRIAVLSDGRIVAEGAPAYALSFAAGRPVSTATRTSAPRT